MQSQSSAPVAEADDWSGITSREERKRRQNRLNQRAHRLRRHAQRFEPAHSLPSVAPVDIVNTQTPTTDLPVTVVVTTHPHLRARQKALDLLRRVSASPQLNLIRPSDLPGVTRLNALNALIQNAGALHIPIELLNSDDGISLFNMPGPGAVPPMRGTDEQLPLHIRPTALQRSVTHHPWLDILPFPGVRDRILLGLQARVLDEDQICVEFSCDLLSLEKDDTSSLLIWGAPWDARAWEFSAKLLERWAGLLSACPEIIQSTNYWRGQRGERMIEYGSK
ncbi:hypothetical protein BJY04DRAFT_221335 [Aspergillus karnatakaensis]|uniref:uncharacterized protein n=1 Tax=Aspergillus karnatakaensis TaxID=1810916 RepID=UPI003CCDB2DA